ncbi:DDE-type integrase/transposase/recombinase, partial [Pseudomonas sp. SA3-5]
QHSVGTWVKNASAATLRSQTGYRRRPGRYGGKPPVASPNHLERRFNVTEPNKVWVTDITYIRTYEGWLYLAVVLDLFSRQVIGWSMKPQMTSDLAIDALLMAVWRRKPKQEVMIHSDQGSQCCSRCAFDPHTEISLTQFRTPNSLLHFAFQTEGLG